MGKKNSAGKLRGRVQIGVDAEGKVHLSIGGAAASPGASISTYKISGGGYTFNSATETNYTTGFLTTAETATFTAVVTDSRGLTASRTVSMNVLPYSSPSITQAIRFVVWRMVHPAKPAHIST